MKKILIATGIAALAFVTVAGAQGYQFSTNLTVGSTGADVVALQTWLISNGYSIPSVASGAAAKGYFGAQTKAAVVAYQTAVGLPSTGFVGPLTRAKLNAGGTATAPTTTTTVTCPVGFVCTPQAGTPTTPTTPTTPAAPVGISTNGVAGTLSVSNSSSVANGATVNDGQSVDVAGYKLQAGPSDQGVTSVTVDFSVRPWLYFSTLSLVNQTTGATIVPAQAISASSFTEITAGSDYRITFSGLSAVVPHGQQVNVVLHGQLLPSVGGTSRQGNINITYADFRSIDGTGVTSDALYSGSTQGVYYQGVLQGNLVVSIDSSSPLNQIIQTQTGASTLGVPIAVYNIQSQNSASTLQGLNVDIVTTGAAPSTVFSSIQLSAGGMTYYGAIASTTGYTSTYSFTNMNIPLALNAGVQFKVIGNVAPGITGDTAKAVLVAPTCVGATACTSVNFNGTDQSYNSPTVQSAGPIASNVTTFSTTGAISVTPGSITAVGTTPSTVSNQGNTAASFNFTFTVAAGNSPIYISANPSSAVTVATNLGSLLGLTGAAATNAGSTSVATQITAGTQIAGDTNGSVGTNTGSFVVQANQSRTFTVTAVVNNATNPTAVSNASIQIAGVNYSTTQTPSTASTTGAGITQQPYTSGLTSLVSPGVSLLTK